MTSGSRRATGRAVRGSPHSVSVEESSCPDFAPLIANLRMRRRWLWRRLHGVVVVVIDAVMVLIVVGDHRAAHATDHGADGTGDDGASDRAGDRALGGVAYGAGATRAPDDGQTAGYKQKPSHETLRAPPPPNAIADAV